MVCFAFSKVRRACQAGRPLWLVLALTVGYVGSASATLWHDGDMQTYGQDNWGGATSPGTGAALLVADYASVYASTSGLLEIGISGTGGFSMLFTNVTNLLDYLPASGITAPLDADLIDPASSAAGAFGGHATALRLNIDFSDAALLPNTTGLRFGDLVLHDFLDAPAINGMTVRQFQDVIDTALGGGAAIYSPSDTLTQIVDDLNVAFGLGLATQFAQDHLNAPDTGGGTVPEPGTLGLVVWGLLGLALAGHAMPLANRSRSQAHRGRR